MEVTKVIHARTVLRPISALLIATVLSSKIYWYGVSGHASGVGCCYKTRFEYVFDLFVDGVACYSRSYNVGWPKCTPAVLSRIIPQYAPIVLESFVDPSGLEKWKAVVEFRDCGRESVVSGMPYINQYGNEIMKEEDREK